MQQDQTPRDAKAIIAQQNAKYEACYLANDVSGLMELYTNDAVIIPPDGPNAIGKAAISAVLGPVVNAVGALKLDTVDAKYVSDDMIIEHTQMTVYTKAGDTLATGKTMVLWKREDGDWKMHWDTWNAGPWT